MAIDYRVRVAKPEDHEAVGVLLEASYPVLMRDSYDPAALAAALPAMTKANPVLLSSGLYYLAETGDGLAVGCGGWSFERPGKGDVASGLAHLRHFATHPDWTGRGVGRTIYALCETAARAESVNRFECFSSLNADGFYAALGFRLIERIELPFGPDCSLPSLWMGRAI